MTAISPIVATGTLSLRVTSGGNALPVQAFVISVEVIQAINRRPSARIVLLDGDVASGDFALSDLDAFAPGQEIVIEAGYGSASPSPIFRGVIVRHGVSISGNNETRLRLDGECTLPEGTDWDATLRQASASGQVVIADHDTLVVQAPQTDADAVLGLTYGVDLQSFDATTDVPTTPRNAGQMPAARGTVTFQGSALAKPGVMISLAAVGKRFSGKVFVNAVTHRIADGNWMTEVGFGIAPEWFDVQRNDLSVTLSDRYGNKLALTPDGITLDSAKDVAINAKGAIRLNAGGNIDSTAQGDIGNVAVNITQAASVSISAKGGVSAELSSSAQTVVKGAMVMIN